MLSMQRLGGAVVALALLFVASNAQAFVWFGDERGLHRVDPFANVIDLDLAAGESVAAATTPDDGSVWSISRSRLVRYASDGTLVFSRSFAALPGNFGNARKIAVNPADATAWVAGERRVARFASGDGALLTVLPGEATDIAVAQDGSLWVLDEDGDELRRYASEGALLQRVNLGGASRRAHHLALDSLRGFAWFVANRALVKRSAATPTQVLQRIDVPHGAEAVCLFVETGDLWVLGGNALYGYGPDGVLFASRDLATDGVANASSLACDHESHTVWAGHRRGVSQYTQQATHLWTVRARDSGAAAVAAVAMRVWPDVTPAGSGDGAFYTESRPVIAFYATALCGVNECDLDRRILESYAFTATLDGLDVSSQLVLDVESGEVRFQSATPLDDGAHTMTMQAADGSGNRSATATITFTIDAQPPALVSVTPPSGTRFPIGTQFVLLDAQFDATATSVWIDNGAPSAGRRIVRQVQVRGASTTFTLHARDATGNVASVPVVYVVEQPHQPPLVLMPQPAQGQVFSAPADIVIEAQATGRDAPIARVEFYLDDTLVATLTSPPYRVVVPGVPAGSHFVSVMGYDTEGFGGASGANVIVAGPPKVVVASPAPGAEVFEGSLVSVTLESAPVRPLQSLVVLRDGQALYTVFNPFTPHGAIVSGVGAHTYGFVATDSAGVQGTAEIALTVKPFDVVVDTPVANSEVTVGTVHVDGRYFGPADTVIRVNGMPAIVTPTSPDGGTFRLGFLPLDMGPRMIEVELSSPSLFIGRGVSIPITVVGVVIVPPGPITPPVGGGGG